MKNQKLKLNELKVKSFTTDDHINAIKGGNWSRIFCNVNIVTRLCSKTDCR